MDAAGLAITLAGTVLKLVVFTTDFVSDAKEVYKWGATDRNLDLGTVAESVQSATKSLENQLEELSNKADGEQGALDPDDQDLKDLAIRAAQIGRELGDSLAKVTIDEKSRWKSFTAVVRGRWDAEDIQKIERRLDGIRGQIQLKITISIRQKVVQSRSEEYARMLDALEHVAVSQAHSREDSKQLVKQLNNAEQSSKGRHEELLSIGNQLLQGLSALSVSRAPSPQPPELQPINDISKNASAAAKSAILSSLWYPTMRDREEGVSESYKNTFEWIYKHPDTIDKPWGDFVDFLERDTSTYWISGKPGSGKSTLMKLINEDNRTKKRLKQWAGENTLLKASFYFFYNGSDMQKSELGLLRSLLHALLSQRPDLISNAFKERFEATLLGHSHPPPSLPEAKRALKQLLHNSPQFCFFLTVDGLDEFDSEVSATHVSSLIRLTRLLGEYPNAKVVLSSRPLTAFEEGYADCPSLMIHELTKDDIRRYATENLMDRPRMRKLMQEDPTNANALLNSIIESSLGVFLWVRLVTESLLEGLTNYDTIQVLQQRVAELPKDLQDLYKAILLRIEPKYKRETAQLLHLVYAGIFNGQELSALGLSYAMESSSDEVVTRTDIVPIQDHEVDDRVEQIRSRLRSRCMGLIEIGPSKVTPGRLGTFDDNDSDIYDVSSISRKAKVGFLHRSVGEFLEKPPIWSQFIELPRGGTFDAEERLLRSIILVIKTCRPNSYTNYTTILGRASYAGWRARQVEETGRPASAKLLDGLDAAVSYHGGPSGNFSSVPADESEDVDAPPLNMSDVHWSVWTYRWWIRQGSKSHGHEYLKHRRFGSNIDGSILAFAIDYNLKGYLSEQVAKHGSKVLNTSGLSLLGHALCDPRPTYLGGPSAEVVKLLLNSGLKPHYTYNNETIWHWFLELLPVDWGTFLPEVVTVKWVYDKSYAVAMKLLILSGADPHATTHWEHPPEGYTDLTFLPARDWTETSCTILLAANRARQLLRHNLSHQEFDNCFMSRLRETVSALDELIELLIDRGASEKEWDNDGNLIFASGSVVPRPSPESPSKKIKKRWNNFRRSLFGAPKATNQELLGI